MNKFITYAFVASIFFVEPIMQIWFPANLFRLPYLYAIGGFFVWILNLYCNKKIRFVISWIDVFMCLLVIYNIADIYKYDYVTKICVFAAFYGLSKNFADERRIAYILTISGCMQIVLLWLQFNDYLPSHHSLFSLKGSFANPGPFGGFLTISLIATISNFRNTNKWLGWFCISLLIIGVFVSNSRASWLAIGICSLYMIMQYMNIRLRMQLSIIVLITILVGICSLTLYKTQSAKGRIEIWKVSCLMIKEQPITGKGIGSFQREYMKYQAQYVLRNPNKQYGNNRYAFNEYLLILCEQGLIGLLLVIIIGVLLTKKYLGSKSILFPCLIAFSIFSCFSYPCDVYLLYIILALLLGSLSAHIYPLFVFVYTKLKYMSCIIGGIIVGFIGYKGMIRECVEKAYNRFLYLDDYEAIKHVGHYYSSIKYSSDFILRYAYTLYLKGEYKLALPVMQQAIFLYPTTDKYCDLGIIYQSFGEFKLAEEAFQDAVNLLPHLIYPHYCLFLLYKDTGESNKVEETAKTILKIIPKKDNEQSREIKKIAADYLNGKL